jgi:indole-3-glycerol phosphate synthase
MHSLIDGILEASRTRGAAAAESWPAEERRDLVASAAEAKRKGLIPIIAEIKPKALGRSLSQEEVSAYARAYAQYGACAISVLTEPTHFKGSLENARTARQAGLPVLRKDFICSEEQLSEVQADLVLLIAALDIDLDQFIAAARATGMEPLVEVHSEEEMERALGTEARIIGINNRNLKTLEVDLGTFERLAPAAKKAGVFLVAESGVHSPKDARRMVQAGADALLVGTSLMEKPERLGELNRF